MGSQRDRPESDASGEAGRATNMRVEGHRIAESLLEQDQPVTALRPGASIDLDQQSLHDMAQIPESREPSSRALLERDYDDPGHAAEVGDIGRQQ